MKDQSRFGIVLVAREKNVVVRASRLVDYISEGIVIVRGRDGAGCGKERRDIRVGIVHVEEGVDADFAHQEIKTVSDKNSPDG